MKQLFRVTDVAKVGLLVGGIIFGILLNPSTSHGDVCLGDENPYGGCALKLRAYPGEFPYAITVTGNDDQVLISDLFSGLFYKMPQIDITSGPATALSFPCPLGQATYTGLAWHSVEDRLYWIADQGAGSQLLVTSTLSGTLQGATMPLTVPSGGTLSGLTFMPESETFWTVDLENDLYLELAPDGTFTGNQFASPGTSSFGDFSYGLGLTRVEGDSINPSYLDLGIGYPSDLRTAQVVRTDTSGNLWGLFYNLDSDNEATGWITGFAWGDVGSSGEASTFICDYTNNRIIEVPTPTLNARSVLDVSCTADALNSVTLLWTNPGPYADIEILRDGTLLETLSGSESMYVDVDLEGDTYSYEINPIPLNGLDLPGANCEVVVGFGRGLNSAPYSGGDPFGITVVESLDQVLVADLTQGSAYFFTKELAPVGSPISSPFGSTESTTGVAWNSTDDTLLWLAGATGQIQKTDLSGGLIGMPSNLTPAPSGPIGDISYSALNDTYFGVNLANNSVIEFTEAGDVVGSICAPPPAGNSPSAHGMGVAVVDDPSSLIIDLPVGPQVAGKVDRVVRLIDCTDSGLSYNVTPTTLSGGIAGIAWTAAASSGLVGEFLVGFDTRTIYEVSLDISSLGDDFQRGDVNLDGTLDISDPTALLIALFAGGTLECLDGADFNDDGVNNIADVVLLFEFLFMGGITPADPFLSCGPDPTIDSITCDKSPICP